MSEKTRMIFRRFPEGDVIALMPDESTGTGYIGSYQHLGQHGDASRDLIEDLEPATQSEIEELKNELEKIGYNIEVSL